MISFLRYCSSRAIKGDATLTVAQSSPHCALGSADSDMSLRVGFERGACLRAPIFVRMRSRVCSHTPKSYRVQSPLSFGQGVLLRVWTTTSIWNNFPTPVLVPTNPITIARENVRVGNYPPATACRKQQETSDFRCRRESVQVQELKWKTNFLIGACR